MEEMWQWLRVCTTLTEDQSFIPSTHSHLELQLQGIWHLMLNTAPVLSSAYHPTQAHVTKTRINLEYINQYNLLTYLTKNTVCSQSFHIALN